MPITVPSPIRQITTASTLGLTIVGATLLLSQHATATAAGTLAASYAVGHTHSTLIRDAWLSTRHWLRARLFCAQLLLSITAILAGAGFPTMNKNLLIATGCLAVTSIILLACRHRNDNISLALTLPQFSDGTSHSFHRLQIPSYCLIAGTVLSVAAGWLLSTGEPFQAKPITGAAFILSLIIITVTAIFNQIAQATLLAKQDRHGIRSHELCIRRHAPYTIPVLCVMQNILAASSAVSSMACRSAVQAKKPYLPLLMLSVVLFALASIATLITTKECQQTSASLTATNFLSSSPIHIKKPNKTTAMPIGRIEEDSPQHDQYKVLITHQGVSNLGGAGSMPHAPYPGLSQSQWDAL